MRRKLDDNGGLAVSDYPESPGNSSYVRDHTKGWNKVIGDWKFRGFSPVAVGGSPSSSRHGLRVTNEVRLPTPNYTPMGSMDNLMESESWSVNTINTILVSLSVYSI